VQEETDQRVAARDGQQNDLFPDGSPVANVFVLARGVGLFARDDHEGVFGEIDTAFVTRSAVALRRGARGAHEEQRSVAAAAESLRVAIFHLALRTFHAAIIPSRDAMRAACRASRALRENSLGRRSGHAVGMNPPLLRGNAAQIFDG